MEIDINLIKPINIDGLKVDCLTMRDPTVSDQLLASELEGSDAKKEIYLIANLCNITPEDVKQLSLKDYKNVQKIFLGMIE